MTLIFGRIKKERELHDLYFYDEKIMVIRKNGENITKKTIINSSELVPGDLIEITNNLIVPADVILIYGSCVVKDNFKADSNSTTTKIAIEKIYKDQI